MPPCNPVFIQLFMGLFWGSSLPKSVIFNTAKTLFPGIVLLKLTHKVNAFYFTTQHTYPLCCCCSVAQSCLTLCIPMGCSTPGFPVFHHLPNLLKLSSIKSVMPPNHLILCCPLLLLPSVFPSISVFSSSLGLLHRQTPPTWSHRGVHTTEQTAGVERSLSVDKKAVSPVAE